jgi:hypothetical protein
VVWPLADFVKWFAVKKAMVMMGGIEGVDCEPG